MSVLISSAMRWGREWWNEMEWKWKFYYHLPSLFLVLSKSIWLFFHIFSSLDGWLVSEADNMWVCSPYLSTFLVALVLSSLESWNDNDFCCALYKYISSSSSMPSIKRSAGLFVCCGFRCRSNGSLEFVWPDEKQVYHSISNTDNWVSFFIYLSIKLRIFSLSAPLFVPIGCLNLDSNCERFFILNLSTFDGINRKV